MNTTGRGHGTGRLKTRKDKRGGKLRKCYLSHDVAMWGGEQPGLSISFGVKEGSGREFEIEERERAKMSLVNNFLAEPPDWDNWKDAFSDSTKRVERPRKVGGEKKKEKKRNLLMRKSGGSLGLDRGSGWSKKGGKKGNGSLRILGLKRGKVCRLAERRGSQRTLGCKEFKKIFVKRNGGNGGARAQAVSGSDRTDGSHVKTARSLLRVGGGEKSCAKWQKKARG